MKTRLLVLFLLAVTALYSADAPHVKLFYYTETLLQYICDAPSVVPQTSVSVAAGTATNIVVSSNVGTVTVQAHGLWAGAVVTVSGSSTSALNATYSVVSVTDENTYVISTSGVSNGTYTTGIRISTNSPLVTDPLWSISVYVYSSGVLSNTHLGGGSLSLNSKAKCSDRAQY